MKNLILILTFTLAGFNAFGQTPSVKDMMGMADAKAHFSWKFITDKLGFGNEKESANANGDKVFSYSGKTSQQIPGTDLVGANKIQITSKDGSNAFVVTFTTSITDDYNKLFAEFKSWGFTRGEEKTADGITGYYYSSGAYPYHMALIQSGTKYKDGNSFTVYTFSVMNINK